MTLPFSKRKQLGLDRKGALAALKAAKKGKRPMTKQQLRAALIEDILVVWSKIVRRRDGYKCQWCGGKYKPQAHHIVARSLSNNVGVFAKKNGMTLCAPCHLHRIPQDPDAYVAFRDKWLKSRGLNYQRGLRIEFGQRGMRMSLEALLVLKERMEAEYKKGVA